MVDQNMGKGITWLRNKLMGVGVQGIYIIILGRNFVRDPVVGSLLLYSCSLSDHLFMHVPFPGF